MKETLLILCTLSTFFTSSQVQIGSDINPLTALGQFGKSISMSSDGNIIAVKGGDINTNKEFVRFFQNMSGVWTQIGSDITDITSTDYFGQSLSLSDNGNIIAIGIPGRDHNGTDYGAVQVYENVGGVWTQIGSDILGQSDYENLGESVSLSADGSIVAIGVPEHEQTSNPVKSGRVEIYKNTGGIWTQIGSDILGESPGNWFGDNLSLSSNGNIVAIGTSRNNESLSNLATGQVEIYENISGVWTQIGSDINGLANERIGESISLSSDGSIVAFGALYSYSLRGCAKIYQNINGVWTQIGSDILGENATDLFGSTISLSSDGNLVAIGSAVNSDNGSQAGHVRIFKNVSGNWIQIGMDIDGENAHDLSAEKNNLSLSSDGTIVAIGAWQNNGGSFSAGAGHVRVFNLSGVLSSDSFILKNTSIYPNPTNKKFTISLGENIQFKALQVYNYLGEHILISYNKEVNIENLSKGLYFVKIDSNQGTVTKKLLVN